MKKYIQIVKKHTLFLLLSLSVASVTAQNSRLPREIKEVERPSENRFYPRSSFMTYAKMSEALTGDYSTSEYYESLDKKWKFLYLKDASQRDNSYVAEDFDDDAWGEISVPSNWEMSGLQRATYADSSYNFSFDKRRMSITSGSAMGIYRTKFKVPYLWEERQIFLHVGGARSASVVYVNGKRVGFSKDSKTPAEYDITKFVEQGYNTLAIEVYNTSSGSFLEAGDSWQLTGINRSVYVYTQPKISIRDFSIRTSLNPEMVDATLELGVVTKSYYLNPKNVKVYYDLIAPDGTKVSYANRSARFRMRSEDTVSFAIPVKQVKKWSAETPNLYTLVLRVQRENRFTEAVALKVGFRALDFSSNRLLVNGAAVKMKGVVYSEHNGRTGHSLSRKQIENDLLSMKDLGINAIRTEHPMPHHFYELCDSIGFYVYDMANISSKPMGESFNKGGSLGNTPIFKSEHIERVVAASQHNRNYPSVVMLGMGMNSGNGYNFYRAYQQVKKVDLLRPIVYEGAGMVWNSDLFCPINPSLEQIKQWSGEQTDRPYIFTEISIDNDMEQKWHEILSSDNLQGGFIASWQAKALPTADGSWVKGSDKQRSILTPSGNLSDVAEQVRTLFSPFVFTLNRESKELTIENRSDFIHLADYTLECSLINGDKSTTITTIADCAPHASTTISLTELLSQKGSTLEILIKDGVAPVEREALSLTKFITRITSSAAEREAIVDSSTTIFKTKITL